MFLVHCFIIAVMYTIKYVLYMYNMCIVLHITQYPNYLFKLNRHLDKSNYYIKVPYTFYD